MNNERINFSNSISIRIFNFCIINEYINQKDILFEFLIFLHSQAKELLLHNI